MSEVKPVLSPDRPVDQIVTGLIQTIHNKGRGFVLGLERGDDGKTAIEVKESLPTHDEWQAPAAYRAHLIEDTESFIAYCLRYGDPKDSLVLYSDACAVLSVKEEVDRGNRELIRLPFSESTDWKDWSAILGKSQSHKDLLRFLMTHEHNLADPVVLKSMQSMKINSTVNIESDIRDEGNSVGIFVKTNAGDELKKFPKQFEIRLPVLDQDGNGEESDAEAPIRLDVRLPDDPKQGPSFTLFCSVWKQIKRGRIDAEGMKIHDGLTGWTVIHGMHQTTERELGE